MCEISDSLVRLVDAPLLAAARWSNNDVLETNNLKSMDDSKHPALDAAALPVRSGTGYPAPFNAPCAGREKRALGSAFGLTDYGVNLVTLPPGTWSSQRHWHSQEDELIYVLEGAPVLVTDAGRTPLGPGMCAGFPAGSGDGHHLRNETDRPVVYLEVGSRRPDDEVEYPDIDMRLAGRAQGDRFRRKDGTPYD